MRYVQNPPNPWVNAQHEWIGEPPVARLEVFEETATRSIINGNDSPDIPFSYSVNCYRGCTHGCTYCFSRPTHEYLGFGAGTDFDRKIVVKVRAAELLREAFLKPKWKGDRLIFSFTSDPYLPLEIDYGLTRQCLEVCLEFRNPVGILTKSAIIRRDRELLASLAREAGVTVYFTIPFLDREVTRALEPFAPGPEARFAAMSELAAAGIEVGLALAPIIPGLNEHEIPTILERAREAGARRAFLTLLRLPGSVEPYFLERLRESLPRQADKIERRLRAIKGGTLNRSRFHERMRGDGPWWDLITQTFALHTRRLGFQTERSEEEGRPSPFRRPADRQGRLFD